MATISTIQFKRGKKTTLIAKLVGDAKPIAGEPIFETDTFKVKIGDGVKDYGDLPYIGEGSSGVEQVFFGTLLEFPKIGEAGKLYVATDEHNNYIWQGNKYVLISVNGHEIDAGGADAQY